MEQELKLLKDIVHNPNYKDFFINSIFEINFQEKEEILNMIKKIEEDNYSNTKEKGQSLENLMKKIFKAENIFKVYQNLHTSSNEIDLVIQLQHNASIFGIDKLFGVNGDKILIECKNYSKKVDVTWVGKFAHLLNTHDINYGIIFSKHSLTGEKNGKLTWKDAAGLTKKFYLKYSKYVVSITLEDIKYTITNNINFSKLLENKKQNIQLDTDIKLIPHENSSIDLFENIV